MATVTICDECGETLGDETENEYNLALVDGCGLSIQLPSGRDLCADCKRRVFARVAKAAWDANKRSRKKEKQNG